MNEEQLTQTIEKILTLNVNANTNVDIQNLIEKYMMYKTIGTLGIGLLWFVSFLCLLYFLYRVAKYLADSQKDEINEEKLEELQKILSGYRDWQSVKDLSKKIDDVAAYMPRNKKPRKTEDNNYF